LILKGKGEKRGRKDQEQPNEQKNRDWGAPKKLRSSKKKDNTRRGGAGVSWERRNVRQSPPETWGRLPNKERNPLVLKKDHGSKDSHH